MTWGSFPSLMMSMLPLPLLIASLFPPTPCLSRSMIDYDFLSNAVKVLAEAVAARAHSGGSEDPKPGYGAIGHLFDAGMDLSATREGVDLGLTIERFSMKEWVRALMSESRSPIDLAADDAKVVVELREVGLCEVHQSLSF